MKQSLGGLIGLTLLYVGWVELAVFPLNDVPCGTNLPDVCGLPYPFLNDMGAGMRTGFYAAAVLGILSSIPGWVLLKNRLWATN